MRFMVMVKGNADTEAGVLPTSEELAVMGRFNDEMIDAGIMLAGEGLLATARGAKLRFTGGDHVVTDGPFTETKEIVAGFWLIEVRDKAEAIAWMKRAPFGPGEELEIRQVADVTDFALDPVSEETLAKEDEWRRAT